MSLPNSSFHNDPNYESAVQDLEQEKKMVAALKRLSIGHMMQYDPDLPPGTMDSIDPFSTTTTTTNKNTNNTTNSPNSSNIKRNSGLFDEDLVPQNIHRKPSTRSRSPPTSPQRKHHDQQQQQLHFPHEPQTPPYNKSPSPVKRRSFYDNASVGTQESHDVFFDAEDEVFDGSSNLLWVPANAHPQVNPESFKSLIKTQVEEILERKLSRRSSLSRKSTLSRSSSTSTKETLALDPETTSQLEKDTPLDRRSSLSSTPQSKSTSSGRKLSTSAASQNQQQPIDSSSRSSSVSSNSESPPRDPAKRESWYANNSKRYLNPSLRELTSELEQLSKMAGMDKNDAVTIARTLSAQSLGYTDVEKLAFDELDSGTTSTTPNSPGSPGSFDAGSPPRTTTLHLQQRLQQQFQQAQQKAEREAESRRQRDHSPQQLSPPSEVSKSGGDFSLKRSRRTDYRKKDHDMKQSSSPSNPSPPTRRYNARDSRLLFNYKKPIDSSSSSSSSSPTPASRLSGHRNNQKSSQHSLEAALTNSMTDSSGVLSNPYPTASTSIDFSRMSAKKSLKPASAQKYIQELPTEYRSSRSKNRPDQHSSRSQHSNGSHHTHHHHQQQHQQLQETHPYQQLSQQRQHSLSRHHHHQQQQQPVPEKHSRHETKRLIPSASNTNINDFMVQLDEFQINGYRQHHRQERSSKREKDQSRSNHQHHHRYDQQQQQPQQPPQQQQPQQYSRQLRRLDPLLKGSASGVRENIPSSHQLRLHQPYPNGSAPAKSQQLHQNLDKLRSEINDFKESLTKTDPSMRKDSRKPDRYRQQQEEEVQPHANYHPIQHDNSFEVSFQDLTVEDQLGIEHEVMKELGRDGRTTIDIDDAFDEDLEVLPIKDASSEFRLDHDILESIPLVENHLLDLSDEEDEENPNERLRNDYLHHTAAAHTSTLPPPPEYTELDELSNERHHSYQQTHEQQQQPQQQQRHDSRAGVNLEPVQLDEVANGYGMNPLPSPTLRLDENRTPGHLRKGSNGASYDDYYNIGERQSSTPATPKTKKESKVKTKLFNKDPNLEIIDSDNYKEKMGMEPSSSKKMKKKKSFGILSSAASIHSGATDASGDETKRLKKKKSWGWLRERSASASTIDTSNLPPLPVNNLPPRSFSNPEKTSNSNNQQGQALQRSDSSSIEDNYSAHDITSMKSTDKENVLSKFFKKKAKVPGASSNSVYSFESNNSGVTVDYESDSDAHTLRKKSSNGIFKKKSKAKLTDGEGSTNKDRLRPLNLVSDESQLKAYDYANNEDKENVKHGRSAKDYGRTNEYHHPEGPYDNEYEQQPMTSSPTHEFNIDHLKDDFNLLDDNDDDDDYNEIQSRSINNKQTSKSQTQQVKSSILMVDDDEEQRQVRKLRGDDAGSKNKKKKTLVKKQRRDRHKKKESVESVDAENDRVQASAVTATTTASAATGVNEQEARGEPQRGGREGQEEEEGEEEEIIQSNEEKEKLDIQEKLKKSIKRTSKANQPIEFTDSAFGFPLPPPSQSTLIMLDYRFPVHVERAIYRLSHLKLANPKRSLREQVLLSNFMYAYLNLVDHTLHLEQQNMSSEDGEPAEDNEEEIATGEENDKDMIFAEDSMIVDDDIVPAENHPESIAIDLDMEDMDSNPHRNNNQYSSIEV